MVTSSILFAARPSWVGILLLLAGICVAWLVVRAFLDFAEWFKEEIIEDIRDKLRRKTQAADKRKKQEDETRREADGAEDEKSAE